MVLPKMIRSHRPFRQRSTCNLLTRDKRSLFRKILTILGRIIKYVCISFVFVYFVTSFTKKNKVSLNSPKSSNFDKYSLYSLGNFVSSVVNKGENNFDISQENETLPVVSENDIRITIWTEYFENPDWGTETVFDLNLREDARCPHKNCVFIYDRTKVEQSKAVVFHASDFNINDVPLVRRDEQIYIWYTLEAPGVYNKKKRRCISSLVDDNFAGSKGFFNWTFTYHTESDVTLGYGKLYPNKSNNTLSISTNKKKLVAWVVSNCHTDSGREKIVQTLQKFIEVDTFGQCSGLPCPDDCFDYLAMRYIFYLSFENNLCEDYITEKLWVPLKAGLIPIVYGGGNYSKYLPENSYINAADYTPKTLAKLLFRLSKNLTALQEYHSWRNSYAVDTRPSWCELCSKLQPELPSTRVVQHNLLPWWLNVNRCYTNFTKDTNSKNFRHSINSLLNLFNVS